MQKKCRRCRAAVEQTALGGKPGTGCFTPGRPRLIVPLCRAAVEQTALPSAAVEQTALGDKPSTGCSTPVRPRLFVLCRAAVEQTALGGKPGTGCFTPGPPRLITLLQETRGNGIIFMIKKSQICTCLNYGVQLLAQNTDLARIELEFYGELGRDRAISDAFKSLFADFRAQIKAILETGISRGEFRPLNTDALAAVVLGIYEGLAMQAMVEPDGLDWPVVSENFCEMVMRGIVLLPKESS